MLSIDEINKMNDVLDEASSVLKVSRFYLTKTKELLQWILDQWELDTKETQDKVLELLNTIIKYPEYETRCKDCAELTEKSDELYCSKENEYCKYVTFCPLLSKEEQTNG